MGHLLKQSRENNILWRKGVAAFLTDHKINSRLLP